MEIDEQSILEQDQQVEDYLQSLNRNGQYGVMLYSNNDLIVPSPDGSTCIKKSLILDNASRQFCSFQPDSTRPFWDSLPEGETEEKPVSISMTFQAVPFCIPVICLDACTIRSYHTRGVMLAATVATTDKKLLTFCVGTAKKENNEA